MQCGAAHGAVWGVRVFIKLFKTSDNSDTAICFYVVLKYKCSRIISLKIKRNTEI